MYMRELLAQCSCGGGNTRISIWAVLVPAAAIFLGICVFEVRTRARTKKTSEPAGDEVQRNRCSDEPNKG